MLNESNSGLAKLVEIAPRPCAFYQAVMPSASRAKHRASAGGDRVSLTGLVHRCMLNPGRTCGPDGEDIGPTACTLGRQGTCQAHRRKKIAGLHATLPGTRAAESVLP